jgi:hypothetical protein
MDHSMKVMRSVGVVALAAIPFFLLCNISYSRRVKLDRHKSITKNDVCTQIDDECKAAESPHLRPSVYFSILSPSLVFCGKFYRKITCFDKMEQSLPIKGAKMNLASNEKWDRVLFFLMTSWVDFNFVAPILRRTYTKNQLQALMNRRQ